MVIGENSREQNMEINITKEKKLTNMRASGSDDTAHIIPPKQFNLEQAIEFLRDGECLEVTPDAFRFRTTDLKSKTKHK